MRKLTADTLRAIAERISPKPQPTVIQQYHISLTGLDIDNGARALVERMRHEAAQRRMVNVPGRPLS